MKITTIPQLYRNLRRWTEILSVLSKYGLADWLSRLHIEFVKDQLRDRQGQSLARLTQETRIRLALSELGPTFIKLGQLLSTRPDVVGVPLADELKLLQCDAPADPPQLVREIIETELGQPIADIFTSFDDVPLASASIGQVHAAQLKTGERVVIKVQHPNIERKVSEDLDVLAGLAVMAQRLPEFAPYRPIATVAELSRTLRREMDFGREERNLQQFAYQYRDDPSVRFPIPYSEYCTSRVLTMERLDGVPLNDAERLAHCGADLDTLARRGAQLYLNMIFTHGFYHADPHPGNILVLDDDVLGVLDCGMVGRLDERLREDIEEMLSAIVQQDVLLLTAMIRRVGSVPADFDSAALAADVSEFVGSYANQSLDQFRLGSALRDMVGILRIHHIILPPQVGMLIKVLITLDGTTRLLSPKFSIMETMRPFHRRMVLRRISPKRRLQKLRRVFAWVEQLAEELPQRTLEILDQVQSGKFDVHLDHRGLEPSVNRLVMGMMTSALFLGSTLLLSHKVPPLLFHRPWLFGLHELSVLGIAGCLISTWMGWRVMRAIKKSGRLDRRQQ